MKTASSGWRNFEARSSRTKSPRPIGSADSRVGTQCGLAVFAFTDTMASSFSRPIPSSCQRRMMKLFDVVFGRGHVPPDAPGNFAKGVKEKCDASCPKLRDAIEVAPVTRRLRIAGPVQRKKRPLRLTNERARPCQRRPGTCQGMSFMGEYCIAIRAFFSSVRQGLPQPGLQLFPAAVFGLFARGGGELAARSGARSCGIRPPPE